MTSITINGIHATFAATDISFNAANNRLGSTAIGTSNKGLVVNGQQLFSNSYAGSGQFIDNSNGLTYTVCQAVYKFMLPFNLFKSINSASISFNQSSLTDIANSNLNFNIRLANDLKRYPPSLVSALPQLGSFSNIGSQNIIIPNAANYINGYNFYLVFSDVNQENNIQGFPTPAVNLSNKNITLFNSVNLNIDYNPINYPTAGFSHFQIKNSGFIDSPQFGNQNIIPANSGFTALAQTEDINSVILYSGSGHQLRNYSISCGQRVLQFADVSVARAQTVEIDIPLNLQGTGSISVYRWNILPNNTQLNYTLVATLPSGGGIITLNILPGQRWFDFRQLNPDSKQIRPIRITEINGKLVSIGF